MKRGTTMAATAAAAAAAMILAPRAALACAVCFGDPNAPETKAMAVGILFMLGCIGTVLASFAGMFCYWAVRSHRLTLERAQELAMVNEGATN
ncbi:MAG: hypothetical protein V3T20_10520 [Gemmatimonadota bacterium]